MSNPNKLPVKNSSESASCRSQAKNDALLWKPKNRETLFLIFLCLAFIAIPFLLLTYSPETSWPLLKLRGFLGFDEFGGVKDLNPKAISQLKEMLSNASMPNKTVIITTLNGAWAENGSMFDFFLESFHQGFGTEVLLQHLIVVALDKKAYVRCISIHPHCYKLVTRGVDFSGEKKFMSADYLKMMWTRILLLKVILETGYNFLFSDADIMWFRNPFPHFLPQFDFQIACDQFYGNPTDMRNRPNGGFVFVRSNSRTVNFYDYWYRSRKFHPNHHDQDVLTDIKNEKGFLDIGLKIRFLDTQFFGGFCAFSRTNLDKVTTMHANCCVGLKAKLKDLRPILDDWKRYRLNGTHTNVHWRSPYACPRSWH